VRADAAAFDPGKRGEIPVINVAFHQPVHRLVSPCIIPGTLRQNRHKGLGRIRTGNVDQSRTENQWGRLSALQLAKSLGGRQVIKDVTLSVCRGEIIGLLGPNGAGKTTTFRMLTGMIAPDFGRIVLDGADITSMPFYERAQRGISYLPQESFVPRSLSVEDNIAMVLEARERNAEKRNETVRSLLSEFHLESVRKKRVGSLSGGQRRRCEIAVTLACKPSFAFLDEPFAGVDPNNVEEIAMLIRHLTRRGVGVLITDHNARELLQLVDRAYVIQSGRVLAHGDTETIVSDRKVRSSYLGEAFRI